VKDTEYDPKYLHYLLLEDECYLLQEDDGKVYLEEWSTPRTVHVDKYDVQSTTYTDKFDVEDTDYVPKYLNYLLKEDRGYLLQEDNSKIYLEEWSTPKTQYIDKYP